MLKFFSGRDDENESLLGAVTEDEGDSPSVQDTQQCWLSRPCLLVLKDGDTSKPGVGCNQTQPNSSSSPSSATPTRGSAEPSQHQSPSQLQEGAFTVTPISTWCERDHVPSSPLVLSPAEAAWPDDGEPTGDKLAQVLPSKEDSVIEEKELEESRLEQQGQSSTPETTAPPCSLSPDGPQSQSKKVRTNGGAVVDSQDLTGGKGRASHGEPDNEGEQTSGGILSKNRGTILGEVAPVWVPDAQAQVCMKCGVKFTFTKRRHHCRACGKGHPPGVKGECGLQMRSSIGASESAPASPVGGPPFSPLMTRAGDGLGKSPAASPQIRRALRPHRTAVNEACGLYGWGTTTLLSSSSNLIPLDGLPPILTSTGVKGDYTVDEQPSETVLIQELESSRARPLVFVLNANLLAMVKLVNYVNRKCWCLTTKGMHAVGQVEVVVLLQCLPEEKSFPKDIFSHFVHVLKHLSLSLFDSGFLGSEEHAGFLYVHSTLQSLQGLPLPNQPYLFGLLVHRAEVAWAKAFPLRLMLRLGAEYRFYPCPLYSVRFRKPLFGEIGHTIMRLLVDFRNYRYSLPMVPGLTVDLEAQRTCIKIPITRYNELIKAINKSNEHVLAFGACFNEAADSHLICVQGEDGQYQTQAISIHNQPRKVTGSCFFIFSSALKASAGYFAKSSIVEDLFV
ncbi:hypothetical protein fugu_005560 [Takifugu bimaculatus]|uniref:Uncharacterized protein n=1 Tax=Takifugu bimaculatus TaxID=433685 RepID=A0A4Z2B6E1_9TELE|nr:hypothetical protein fugu_005560 [Takifugu bimaculatus]